MTVAILTAKRPELHGLADFVGFDEWLYIVVASWISIAGPGPLSLDHLARARAAAAVSPV